MAARGWKLLDAMEAAAMLGVSLRSFRRHVAPAVPSVRMGRSVRYDPRDLEVWIEARKGGGQVMTSRARAEKRPEIVIDELTQRRAREALGALGLLGSTGSARRRRSS